MLAPEPGALSFGVLDGAAAGQGDGLRFRQLCGQQRASFAVADGGQQGQAGAVAADQLPGFLHQAIAVELLAAPADALAQVRGVEAQLQQPPWGRAGSGLGRVRPARGIDHLQGPLGAHGIGGGDPPGGEGIGLSQELVAEGLTELLQLGPQGGLGWHRRWFEPLGQGPQVEAAAAHQQGHTPAAVFGGDGRPGDGAEFLQVDRLVGIAQVQQLMAHPGALLGARFGGADAHAPVKLAGIDRKHGQIQGFGQLDRQGGLTAGGGSHQGDQQRRQGHGILGGASLA